MSSEYDTLRLEALPYARKIVEAGVDRIDFVCPLSHRIEAVAGAIASTAVTRGHSVLETVQRVYPDVFPAHPSASLRDRVTRASPRADKSSRPSAGTALRGDAPGQLGNLVTTGTLLLWLLVIPAIFGGM